MNCDETGTYDCYIMYQIHSASQHIDGKWKKNCDCQTLKDGEHRDGQNIDGEIFSTKHNYYYHGFYHNQWKYRIYGFDQCAPYVMQTCQIIC